jgi:hypothetical protein
MIQCEFNQGSKFNPHTGRTEHNVLCKAAAGYYRCKGELTSLVMPLCEYHKDFVTNRYHWKVDPVKETATK